MRGQVGRALAGLVTVLQEDGCPSLIRSPGPFIVGPFPENTTAQAGRLSEERAANRASFSCVLPELLQSRYIDEVLGQAWVRVAETDAVVPGSG